ncbi:general substrate transporter [Stemphylium lycopersici]|nr:sugar transporter stl1 protein [Stemphylium lycopersici]RAR10363.1 general substrate transporter [Stemphylium lycopersici]
MASTHSDAENRFSLHSICLIVAPAFWLYGYNQANLGGATGFESFAAHFPQLDTIHTEGAEKAHNVTIQATVVAIYTIGCLFGALSTISIANRLGRRYSLVLSAAIASIGLVLQASSFSLAQLIVGRIISGIGVGGVNAVVPVWLSECAVPKSRGKNVVVLGSFVASGIALAAWVNYGLSYHQESQLCWRLSLAMPLVFALPLVLTPLLLPESPRWLVQKGELAAARASYSVIRATQEDDASIHNAVEEIRLSLGHQNQVKSSFIKLLRNSSQRNMYRVGLAFTVNFAAQMTGANAVSYYGTTIFHESLGFGSHQSSLLAACVLTWKIFTAFLAYATVDRVGRRALLLTSAVGMSSCMVALAVCVSQLEHSKAAGDVAALFLFLFMAFFPLGFLGANFLYATEVSTQELRVHLSAIGVATHWLCNFIVAEITPICFAEIGYQTYIVYGVIGAALVPVIWFFFPETNGRTLEEIDYIFMHPSRWWKVTRFANSYQALQQDAETSQVKALQLKEARTNKREDVDASD